MAFVNAIIEIDKAGRVVLPKKIRDAMHLRAGDRLSVELAGDILTIASEHRGLGLYQEGGWLVFDSGVPISEAESLRQIDDDRNARMDFLASEAGEP